MNARRDFLKFAGGAVLGIGASPLPWKLLDDTSIWTQNWNWTPKLARGEITFKPAACTLCPRGCAVSVRCVGAQPVGIKPRDGSTLCPEGYMLHQAPYRPSRIRNPSAPVEEAANFVRDSIRIGQVVAVVDPAPGRVASSLYRRFVESTPNALYIADTSPATLRAYEEIERLPFRSAGVALGSVRTVVAVEAPVLERWGTPGLLMRRRGDVRIVYAGANGGVTAELADACIPMSAVEKAVADAEKPVLVMGGEHLPWSTHLELAAMNRGGGAINVSKQAGDGALPRRIDTIADRSIGVLLVDGAGVSMESLRPKLKPDCVTIAITAFANEYTKAAKFVIPAPAPLESVMDLAAPFDSDPGSFRLAPAVIESGAGVTAADFVARLSGQPALREAIDNRIAEIHVRAKGKTLEEFRTMLLEGGVA